MGNVSGKIKLVYGKTAEIFSPPDFSRTILRAMERFRKLVASTLGQAEMGETSYMETSFLTVSQLAAVLGVPMSELKTVKRGAFEKKPKKKIVAALKYERLGQPGTVEILLKQAYVDADKAKKPWLTPTLF